MRALRRIEGKWRTETPESLSKWLWKHDGDEAVVVDDTTHTYYCGRPEMFESYQAAWSKECKVGDQRKAAMFIDLDRLLFEKECLGAP